MKKQRRVSDSVPLQDDFSTSPTIVRSLFPVPGTLSSLLHEFQVNPRRVEAAYNLAQAFIDLKDYGHALDYLDAATKIQPDPSCWVRRGDVLVAMDRAEEAIQSYDGALRLNPQDAEIYFKRGSVLLKKGNPGEATKDLRKSLELKPRQSRVYSLLASHEIVEDMPADGLLIQLRTLVKYPDKASMMIGAAAALLETGRYEDAKHLFLECLSEFPEDSEALHGLAETQICLGEVQSARLSYERALKVAPYAYTLFFDYLKLLLRINQVVAAKAAFRKWIGSQPRYRSAALGSGGRSFPEWRGEPLEHKTLLLRPSKDNGDTIQFQRFASLMKEQGATVVVESHRNLAKLLPNIQGVDLVVTKYEDLPSIDFEALPAVASFMLDWTWESLAKRVPYINLPQALLSEPQRRRGQDGRLLVGITWCGAKLWEKDKHRYRAIPLREFEPIARIPGVALYSLQFGAGSEEISDAPFQIANLKVGDFLDTAAEVEALDLIITIDTAMAHLAGGLGKQCFVMLPYVACWRWLLERNDSPQYPSLMLFRQVRPGNWSDVIAAVALQVEVLVTKTAVMNAEMLETQVVWR